MGEHLIDGEFQSDKYPECPRGKVPLSTNDPDAHDLLWIYAQRRRAKDPEFSDDLEKALLLKGYTPKQEHVPWADDCAKCGGITFVSPEVVNLIRAESVGVPELPADVDWTTKSPTEPGLYWSYLIDRRDVSGLIVPVWSKQTIHHRESETLWDKLRNLFEAL